MTRVYLAALLVWAVGSLILIAGSRLRRRRAGSGRDGGVTPSSPQGWDFR